MRPFIFALALPLSFTGGVARAQDVERRVPPTHGSAEEVVVRKAVAAKPPVAVPPKAPVRPPGGVTKPAPAAAALPQYGPLAVPVTGGTPPSGAFVTDPIHPIEKSAPARPESRDEIARRAYTDGVALNARVTPADAGGWNAIARMTGLGHDELVRAWDAVYVVDFTFRYLLRRAPTSADSARAVGLVNRMRGGEGWEAIWRDVAQSAERERRFGFFAPAPFASPSDAQRAFGLGFTPTPEQCFGALGDKCEGGIPALVNGQVQPMWTEQFTLPDGTAMGFVTVGVAVGSILHDNSCLRDHGGLNCNGIGAGDLIKHGGPADDEWNKAAWNVMDHRAWRDRFGPYPLDRETRRSHWYDDLRAVPSREAWMAPSLGMVTIPVTTVRYAGGETRQSQQLAAPAGAWMDERDGAFCRSKALTPQLTLPPKSAAGTCR